MGELATLVVKSVIILGVLAGYFGLIIRVARLRAAGHLGRAVLLVAVATFAAVITLMAVSFA